MRSRVLCCWLLLLGTVVWCAPVAAAPLVIKFATLAPEGTPWMRLMQAMNAEIQRRSAGQIAFRFYAGGVAGDERDVLRKMRIRQLHGGAFSGFGLGEILPEVRVLELPLLFRDAEEAEHVARALFPRFAAGFQHRGYVLLNLDAAGPVYIFSQQPLRSRADLARAKMWTWQGDPLPLAMFRAYGVAPVPLALPDVLPALQSGLITACYGPPLAILALQWFTRVRYRLAFPITHVMGALVLSAHIWQRLTAEQQTLVRQTVAKYSASIVQTMRRHHDKALALLQSLGIRPVDMPAAEVTRLQRVSQQVREALAGTLYARELLARVLQLRDAYRQERANQK